MYESLNNKCKFHCLELCICVWSWVFNTLSYIKNFFQMTIFFVYLGHTQFLDSTLKTCKYLSIPGHIVLLESLLTFSRLKNENENVSSFLLSEKNYQSTQGLLPELSVHRSWQRLFSRIIFISLFNVWQNSPYIFTSSNYRLFKLTWSHGLHSNQLHHQMLHCSIFLE